MKDRLSVRTTTAIIAITMLILLVLLTTSGNPALGQSLPSIGFTETSIERSTSQTTARTGRTPYSPSGSAKHPARTVSVQYRTEDFTATETTGDYISASGTLYF